VVRAEDGKVLASADLDASKGSVDAMGFKCAALSTPLRLDAAAAKPVVVKPRGLKPELAYDVRCAKSNYQASKLGSSLMQDGIEFPGVEPGELIFLNLASYPGFRHRQDAAEPSSKCHEAPGDKPWCTGCRNELGAGERQQLGVVLRSAEEWRGGGEGGEGDVLL
jgi:hypothetical protein